MRRYAPALIAAASGALLLAPLIAHAAGIPYFGPIIPSNDASCPGNWALLITVVNNIIALALTIAVIFIAPLLIAYAGFLYLTSGASPANRGKANGVLTNTIVGLVVALAAWIIVDAVMAALYNGNAGAWYSIISSGGGESCLSIAGALNQSTLPNGQSAGITGSDANGNVYVNGSSLAQCSSSNPACSVSTLEADGLSAIQADVMSCIAVTESSGNPSTPPYNQTHPGSDSSACGTFQITQTTWKSAASGSCADFSTSCQNATCNAQVAATLVSRSGYSSWTCPGCNSKAASCVQTYGG
jgi:hypothetical protein